MHPVNAKKLNYLGAQASILRSTGLSVKKKIPISWKKSERWVVKWSSRNDGFEHKKRTGRPKILNEAAKRILNKAKYKRGNSTRQLSQQLASKGHVEGKNTIWRFMKSEGWRPLRRQKKNMLTAKQRATQCRILTFRIYVLSKAINVFMQKCSFDQCSKRNERFGHPALWEFSTSFRWINKSSCVLNTKSTKRIY